MNSRRCGYKKINLNAEDAKDFAKGAAENLCVPLRKPPRPLRLNDLSLSVSLFSITLFILAASFTASAQRAPSQATRPFVVMAAQSLDDLKQKLQPAKPSDASLRSHGRAIARRSETEAATWQQN